MREGETVHAWITASHLLSVKGDKGEDQKQRYSIINLGYYNNLETAANMISLLVKLNTFKKCI